MDTITVIGSKTQFTMSAARLPLVEHLVKKLRDGVYEPKAAPHSVEEADAMLTIKFVATV
jgi:hypothetical protein